MFRFDELNIRNNGNWFANQLLDWLKAGYTLTVTESEPEPRFDRPTDHGWTRYDGTMDLCYTPYVCTQGGHLAYYDNYKAI